MDNNLPKACQGGRTTTISTGTNDYEKCLSCNVQVRWDLLESTNLGFRLGCTEKEGEQNEEE